MRVCIVSPYDPRPTEAGDPRAIRGGVEEALDRQARGLALRGHEVTLVCSASRTSDTTGPDGVRILRVKRRGTLFRNPIAPLHDAVPRNADVVLVPATYPFVSDLIPAREARRGRATVLDYHFDVHGTTAAMRAAAWAHFRTLAPRMMSATRIACKSTSYAAHSPFLARVPPARLDVVPNGVDVSEFRPRAAKGDDILCVGRLVPYKGIDVLLRAMPEIHRATGAHLTIVGSGPERARLLALADAVGAPARFAGRLPRAVLARAYAEARVTVLPSANAQEAFGIVLLESMAAGTPVVASDLPGVREIATLAGLVAKPQDPTDLAARVIEAWRDPGRFGTPAAIRARVRERYGWRAVVDGLERVLGRAVAEAGRA